MFAGRRVVLVALLVAPAVRAEPEPLFSLTGHTAGVFHVVYSPDGKLLATASRDNTARLWDAATGKPLFTLTGHSKNVYSTAFSPDGKLLATAGGDRSIKVWDTATGKELRTITGHGDDVYSVAFSPDGSKLASGCSDRTVIVWDAVTGDRIHTLSGHTGRVLSVAFNPDGTRLASACASNASNASEPAGEVRLWDVAAGALIYSLPARNVGVVTVAFSPDGKRLAGSCLKQTVTVWEVATGQEALTLAGHTLEVYHVSFSADGRRLASCSGKWSANTAGELKVWNVFTGKEELSLKPHTMPIWGTAFSPDGKRLASASGKFTAKDTAEVKVWDLSALPARMPVPPPDARHLQALWDDLAGSDAAKAYRAVLTLDAVPKLSVPFLKAHVKPPVGNAVYERIPKLIAALDDNEFEVREKAARELEKIGQVAHAALRKALADGPPEVKRQAAVLLEAKGEAAPLSAEEVQMIRAIEVLQHVGTPDVRPALQKLAGGAVEAPVTREAVLALKLLERKAQK